MRVAAVETFIPAVQPNVCIVRITTEDGLVGHGETFYGAPAVESYIHDLAAPRLFAVDFISPAAAATVLVDYAGRAGSGTETRGRSAIDIALWDLIGRRAGLPLTEVLGGAPVDGIPVYNTCAGPTYVASPTAVGSANWGLPRDKSVDPRDDLWAFFNEPARLARELLDAGYSGLKVWPFDLAAERSSGAATADLREGLRVVEAIRGEVGVELDLYVELHHLWTLPGARRLVDALAPYSPAWVEDPLRPDLTIALEHLARDSLVPIAGGETLAGPHAYRALLETNTLATAIVDLGWTGGITVAAQIAALADTFGVTVAAHDCTGPIALTAALHWALSTPNAHVQEITRAFYQGWYRNIVTELPPLVDGQLRPLDAPGLGVELHPSMFGSDVRRRQSLAPGQAPGAHSDRPASLASQAFHGASPPPPAGR